MQRIFGRTPSSKLWWDTLYHDNLSGVRTRFIRYSAGHISLDIWKDTLRIFGRTTSKYLAGHFLGYLEAQTFSDIWKNTLSRIFGRTPSEYLAGHPPNIWQDTLPQIFERTPLEYLPGHPFSNIWKDTLRLFGRTPFLGRLAGKPFLEFDTQPQMFVGHPTSNVFRAPYLIIPLFSFYLLQYSLLFHQNNF